METKELTKKLLSKNLNWRIEAAQEVIKHSHLAEKITPLSKYLPILKENLSLGTFSGHPHKDQVLIDFSLEVIEFYNSDYKCHCELYTKEFPLTNDYIVRKHTYSYFDPEKELQKGVIHIESKVRLSSGHIDHYLVKCSNCKNTFIVKEGGQYSIYWKWTLL